MIELLNWITTIFPSLAQYTKVFLPLVITTATVLGIFSDIMPAPGEYYPVPNLDDLDAELKDKGRLVYWTVRVSRQITLFLNAVIDSRGYRGFYKFTAFCSLIVRRFKGQDVKAEAVEITPPQIYTFKRLRRQKSDETKD